MAWSPKLRVSFTDEELVAKLAATHDRPEERAGNWFTFFSNLPVPERTRLEALAASRSGAPAVPRKPHAAAAAPAAPAPRKARLRHSGPAAAHPTPETTIKELLDAARQMTDAAQHLAKQMNDLANKIAGATKGAGES